MALVQQTDGSFELERDPLGDRGRAVPYATYRQHSRHPGVDGPLARDEYTDEQREFLQAMDTYKRKHSRPFPSWCEVLSVVKSLGYSRPDRTEG